MDTGRHGGVSLRPEPCTVPLRIERTSLMALILWILAVILVVSGIIALVRKQVLYGVVLIIVGLLVGPGGVSIFT